ncbi:phage holin family protein [Canibacter sp. lx-72]|uniref:phage holin family protein n=1 Tax=Canibacter zhuwentaonis TaxID=2837491 RepID=UPI001BDC0172|nr:phage holin family protein [Canibacter zhuwentaonis]MBT1017614.1 phage holin family protein [Canibacter zhuwentaonis]
MPLDHYLRTIAGIIGAAAGWVFGTPDALLYTLLAFITADYISGVMAAITTRKLSSAVGFKGLFGKMLILAFVALAQLMDTHVLGEVGVLRGAVIFFYIANEGISLIENATVLGLPVPPKFQQALATLTDHDTYITHGRHAASGVDASVPRPHIPPSPRVSEVRKPLAHTTKPAPDEETSGDGD